MPLKLGEREMHAASKTLRARFIPLQTRERDACRYRFFWRHAFRSLTLKAAYIRLASFKAACISLASIVGKVASYPDPTPILPRTVLRFTETDVNAEKEMATSTWEEEVKALASPDAQNPHSAALREYVVAFQSDLHPYREDWILMRHGADCRWHHPTTGLYGGT